MVSFKQQVNAILQALISEAEYLRIPEKNIKRTNEIYPPPFIAILPDSSTAFDSENIMATMSITILASIKAKRSIEEMQDDAMDLQARILSVLEKNNITFTWQGSALGEQDSKGTPLDNPWLEIQITTVYNPLLEGDYEV